MFRILLLCVLCGTMWAQPRILVSVAPQKFLVEQIAGERVEVEVIVPEGMSPHTYEPSPRQMIALSGGEIWFRLGESFEGKLVRALQGTVEIVDQREGLDLLYAGCCCCHEGHDPHIWMSPRMLKDEAGQMARVLAEHYPESAPFFQKNYLALCAQLDALDGEIAEKLAGREGDVIMVSHPAFGYFCRDYGLRQLAIETEGKEPSTRRILELLEQGREAGVSAVYLQRQHSMKGAEKIAKALGADVVMVNPYEEDVIANLAMLAETL